MGSHCRAPTLQAGIGRCTGGLRQAEGWCEMRWSRASIRGRCHRGLGHGKRRKREGWALNGIIWGQVTWLAQHPPKGGRVGRSEAYASEKTSGTQYPGMFVWSSSGVSNWLADEDWGEVERQGVVWAIRLWWWARLLDINGGLNNGQHKIHNRPQSSQGPDQLFVT